QIRVFLDRSFAGISPFLLGHLRGTVPTRNASLHRRLRAWPIAFGAFQLRGLSLRRDQCQWSVVMQVSEDEKRQHTGFRHSGSPAERDVYLDVHRPNAYPAPQRSGNKQKPWRYVWAIPSPLFPCRVRAEDSPKRVPWRRKKNLTRSQSPKLVD